MTDVLLDVKGLGVRYDLGDSFNQAVDNVSFGIKRGECFGLVGESGSGKSTIAKSITKLLSKNAVITGGSILWDNRDITNSDERAMRNIRWEEISIIPQSAMNALDPVARISKQISETFNAHGDVNRKSAIGMGMELFERVGLNRNRIYDFPHQFSGGMRQRVAIALAIALDPSLIIADEPTTALDVIMQAQVLNLLKRLLETSNSSLLLITHDISVVAEMCHRVGVMYGGQLMEYGDSVKVFNSPHHPYTIGLKGAFPSINEPQKTLVAIPGSLPTFINDVLGCRFANRCPFSSARCRTETPTQFEVDEDHCVACHEYTRAAAEREEIVDIYRRQTTNGSYVGESALIQGPEDGGTEVVEVSHLFKWFPVKTGIIRSIVSGIRAPEKQYIRAVNDISFSISRGEILGLAGESGCGKTTTAHLLLALSRPTKGTIAFEGDDIANFRGKEMARFRKKAQMVFQDPYESLNPRFTVQRTVEEPLIVNNYGDREERVKKVKEVLERVKLKPVEKYLSKYPHELSGGERQRVVIAAAVVLKPTLLVADEAVSMLDVSIRAGILELLRELTNEMRMATLYISHDLSLLVSICDRVAIMYAGNMVEIGRSADVIRSPRHPYTKALIAAVPIPEFRSEKRELTVLRGEIPDLRALGEGCSFMPRCDICGNICKQGTPELREVSARHYVACYMRGN